MAQISKMINDNWKNEHKIFIETVEGSMSKDIFLMAMLSGEIPTVVAMTPKLMKIISQWFTHYTKQYEEQYGEIKHNWIPPTKTPFLPTTRPKPIDPSELDP